MKTAFLLFASLVASPMSVPQRADAQDPKQPPFVVQAGEEELAKLVDRC